MKVNECGGVFGGMGEVLGGNIKTPNYPQKYESDSWCVWLLAVEPGLAVSLTFNTFQLSGPTSHTRNAQNLHQNVHATWSCSLADQKAHLSVLSLNIEQKSCNMDRDFVQILNGPDLSSPVLNTFCSTNKPELKSNMHSTGNEVIIIFKSDSSSQTGTGFDLSWGTQDDECGNQIIQGDAGVIKSPGFPQKYEPSQNCLWRVKTLQSWDTQDIECRRTKSPRQQDRVACILIIRKIIKNSYAINDYSN